MLRFPEVNQLDVDLLYCRYTRSINRSGEKGVLRMSAVDLAREGLTSLPARYETRQWGRGGGNINIAYVNQVNYSEQYMSGCVVGCVQNNVQLNIAIIVQR
jgi:hypothetical protein